MLCVAEIFKAHVERQGLFPSRLPGIGPGQRHREALTRTHRRVVGERRNRSRIDLVERYPGIELRLLVDRQRKGDLRRP